MSEHLYYYNSMVNIVDEMEDYYLGRLDETMFLINKSNLRYIAFHVDKIFDGPLVKKNFRWLLFNGESVVGNFGLEEDAILLQTQIGGKIIRVNMDEAS